MARVGLDLVTEKRLIECYLSETHSLKIRNEEDLKFEHKYRWRRY